ncbi:beta-ketoacyl-ACP synthase III [Magnetococcales bacterium HHB-1]
MSQPRAVIAGTGSYLPENVLTNHDLAKMVDTSDTWIHTRTGIIERRLASKGEYTSDLAVAAATPALEAAGVAAEELDLILVATTTPDRVFPSTATIVQHKLGANKAKMPAFDVQAVCTGFIYALSVAETYIQAGKCRHVLVIGAETFSRIVDWTDRTTCILFGDGAGAVVLSGKKAKGIDEQGILTTQIHADGAFADLLKVSGGVSMGVVDHEHESENSELLRGLGSVQMRGNEVYKQAVRVLGMLVDDTLSSCGFDKSDLDWLVPHQANIRIIRSTAKKLGMNLDQVVVTVDRHGNTSAASVPLALDEAVRDGRIQPGQLVLLEAFGGGFTWGSALVRW